MDNASLDEIPTETIQYIPGQDRVSCSFVCREWIEALNMKELLKTHAENQYNMVNRRTQ